VSNAVFSADSAIAADSGIADNALRGHATNKADGQKDLA
jgi:hypothetical protein